MPLSDLWEKDEFAKTVHLAIEGVSSELRAISLKVPFLFKGYKNVGNADCPISNQGFFLLNISSMKTLS